MIKTKNIVACGLVTMLSFGALGALTGCDSISSVVSSNPIGEALMSSKKTGQDDYKNYGTVQDVDGNEYVTVAYFEQVDNTEFDVAAMKEYLSAADVNWYQLIASSAMGTKQKQYGYLFFTPNASYTEITDAVDAVSKKFEGHICTVKEYEKFVEDSKEGEGTIDLYHSKNTYYGPAAGK